MAVNPFASAVKITRKHEFKGDNAKKQNKENLLKTKQHALQSKGVKQKQQTNKKKNFNDVIRTLNLYWSLPLYVRAQSYRQTGRQSAL